MTDTTYSFDVENGTVDYPSAMLHLVGTRVRRLATVLRKWSQEIRNTGFHNRDMTANASTPQRTCEVSVSLSSRFAKIFSSDAQNPNAHAFVQLICVLCCFGISPYQTSGANAAT